MWVLCGLGLGNHEKTKQTNKLAFQFRFLIKITINKYKEHSWNRRYLKTHIQIPYWRFVI